METRKEATLLRIFVGSIDKIDGRPIYELIVFAANKKGMAGATVIRGIMGYGSVNFIYVSKILELSEEIPVIVEIVDEDVKIEEFIKEVDPLLKQSKHGGLITTEKVNVFYYKGH
jgi:uncharacterized protein